MLGFKCQSKVAHLCLEKNVDKSSAWLKICTIGWTFKQMHYLILAKPWWQKVLIKRESTNSGLTVVF